ncbi:MAG: EamA family transporter [Ferruginibacter sp.]
MKFVLAGIFFAILWASASTATKIGLGSAQPFMIATSRFFIAGIIMLFVTHVIRRNRMPTGVEWRQVIIYGLLNISVYLGLFVIAMQEVSAGLGSLAVAANPVFIALMAAAFFSHKIKVQNILSLLLCLAGVVIAAYPLLHNSFATLRGISLLMVSMVAYSAGTLYYSRVKWNGLHILTINGWQTMIGGLFLLPVLFFTYRHDKNNYDHNFWKSVVWLAVPVSIGAVQLWLFLVRQNAVKASYWLFLSPIFGFIIARTMMNEPINLYTVTGVMFVLSGLYIVQRIK